MSPSPPLLTHPLPSNPVAPAATIPEPEVWRSKSMPICLEAKRAPDEPDEATLASGQEEAGRGKKRVRMQAAPAERAPDSAVVGLGKRAKKSTQKAV